MVVVLRADHRLAGRAAVRMADLAGEPQPRWPVAPGSELAAAGGAAAGPDGATGPAVRDSGELMELIALGRLVAVLPDSVRGRLRAGLLCVPVLDAPPTTLVLAWPERSRSLAVAAFIRVATDVAATVAARRRRTVAAG
jgi:hypothetical protein